MRSQDKITTMKVCFETFGCRLNRAEALEEEAKLLADGWQLTHSHSDADMLVIRGCSVTSRAQHDCERLIAHLRMKYPNKRIVIQGCLADATKPGTQKITQLRRVPTAKPKQERFVIPTRTARAYLKVQDGCSGKCTFCIVPKFRGTSTSIGFDEVMDRAKRFIEAGYHEIVVTGCNLSLYASQGKRLPELLSALAEIGSQGHCRIRLGSLEPGGCAIETVNAIADHDNICNFLHLTIQSGSNKILSAMRRPYLIKDVEKTIGEALSRLPKIGLGCDLISGFPDESEMDHLASKALLSDLPFSNAHIFPYSKRPQTLAAAFPNPIPRETRSARAHELARIADEKRRGFAKRFVGEPVDVLIEDEENQAGWTAEYIWFERKDLTSTPTIPRKHLATFTVSEVKHGHLRG